MDLVRRRGHGLKSHPTDWEKTGIEPATPGLQDIGLSPTPRRRVPWLYQYWAGGIMVLWFFLCRGAPEGSTDSGSGFKASQKTGQQLKVSSDRLGEAGNRTCDPGLQDIGLSSTSRRLKSNNYVLRLTYEI